MKVCTKVIFEGRRAGHAGGSEGGVALGHVRCGSSGCTSRRSRVHLCSAFVDGVHDKETKNICFLC
jgi:hypothetical protein